VTDPRPQGPDPATELAEAKRKLAEAEATLEAIRMGNVDALVVSGKGGEEEIRSILNMGSLANSIFNQVAQPVFILDSRDRIQRLNPAAAALVGEACAGKPFLEALPLRTEAGGDVAALRGWADRRARIEALDVELDHPVLGRRSYLVDASTLDTGWGGEPGGIVTLMDITARKLADVQLAVRNGQLRRQFNLLKAITDNIPEGLLLLDEERHVIFHNPAAVSILGAGDTDLAGQDAAAFFRPKSSPEAEGYLELSMEPDAAGGVRRGLLARRDGGWMPVQFALHPLKGETPDGAESILVISDISDLVSSEKALMQSLEKQQHSQKMEAIGRLAGGIAHDFNNLLLAILGFTDLSLVQAREDTQLHDNLKEVKRAGERAAALTAQLLAYSRKQILDPKVHDLNDAVHDVLKMLGRLIGENIRLQVDNTPERLPARFDQAKLQQVLVNMTLNARDAMPEGGTLSLRTGLARITLGDRSGMVRETRRESEDGIPAGEFVYVEIEDTGHGMGEEVLEHLFEPFFTTKEFGKGSGLGLSTAYGIVRQMGGHVQVFSAPGKGSRFRVLFPLARGGSPALSESPSEALPAKTGAGERILLVEDENVVRKLLAKLLTDQGFQVIEAADGEEALRRLPGPGEPPLSLVVTDIVMDRMGGIELAERLSRLRPGLDVLFISGYAEDQHKLPMDGPERPFFAAKPFRPVDFLGMVRTILERKAGGADKAAKASLC
jgi:PAS domain S-box-containing protein